jgi:peptidoglycan biosynthesis protein MviN/MurJ (putative lipid II flippase)
MKKRLAAKGWSRKDIEKAEASIKKAELKKHPDVRKVERSMFWFTQATGVLGTIILSFAIIPVLVAGSALQAGLVAALFGILLGWMIAYFSRSMHWIEMHEHQRIVLAVAAVAFVNLALVTVLANQFNEFAGIATRHEPVAIAASYAVFFLIPFYAARIVLGGGRK